MIIEELASFSAALARKPMVIAASKIDALQDSAQADRLEGFCKQEGLPFFRISAVTGEGIEKLKYYLGSRVREARESAAGAK